MKFSLMPQYELSKRRYDAFWNNAVFDRPPISGIAFQKNDYISLKDKKYSSYKEQWLDIDRRAEEIHSSLMSKIYYGDTLPVAFPNMGPEIYSAWCGCPYYYTQTTTWSEPCIQNLQDDFYKADLDMEHPLFKMLEEFTVKLIERGKGHYIVGLTDFHPGGDHLAALRDPQQLAIDLIESPKQIKALLNRSYPQFFKAYDYFFDIIKSADMPITTWLNIISDEKFYVLSNDFSCMISSEMFVEFFLPGLIEEAEFFEKSIYHLDGPGALHHLDTLLEVNEIDAIQWVAGAGNFDFEKWLPVYKKIQNKKKGIDINCIHVGQLDLLFDNLKPEGVWLSSVQGIESVEDYEYLEKRVSNWK